jgi:hypothetical protein
MGDKASRRGAVDLGLPLMIVAFLSIGGFLYWLNLQAKAELAEKAAIAEEIAKEEAELAAMGDFISGETLQRDPAVFLSRVIAVEGLSVASMVGTQGFWLELPNKNPFLVSMSEAVKAEGLSLQAGMGVTVSGMIHVMTDSVLNAWSTAGAISEGDRLAAEFATHYLEAARIKTGADAVPTGGGD